MKRIPEEIARKGVPTCHACSTERNRASARHRYYLKAGVPDGWRLCRWCGNPKQVGVDMTPLGRTCRTCRYQRKIQRARVTRRDRIARMDDEQRRIHRAKQAAKARRQRSTPEGRARHNAQQKAWREAHPDAAAAAQKRYRKNIMADPEKRAEWRDYQRIYHRIWRERKGMVPRHLTEQEYRNGNGSSFVGGNLDVKPLADLISEWLGTFGGQMTGSGAFGTESRISVASYRQLAELSGVSSRTLREIHTNKRTAIHFSTADAVCTALDTPIGAVYR
jgi:hypothetical protein